MTVNLFDFLANCYLLWFEFLGCDLISIWDGLGFAVSDLGDGFICFAKLIFFSDLDLISPESGFIFIFVSVD